VVWQNIVTVGIGGAIGSALRYFVVQVLPNNNAFPFNILVINLIGSFLIGLLYSVLKSANNEHLQLFLLTGLLGGFTTFSAFSLDNLKLFQEKEFILLFVNIVASTLGGFILAFVGIILGEKLK